jgi:hypothetical protein
VERVIVSRHTRVVEKHMFHREDPELFRRANLHAYKAISDNPDEESVTVYQRVLKGFGFVWAPEPYCAWMLPEGVNPDISEIDVADIGKPPDKIGFYLR